MMFGIEQDTGATAAFGLYDADAVLRLVKDEPNLLPMPEIDEEKDYQWYNKIINNAVTQGIIQGESLDKICLRISEESGERGLNALRRNARTAYTGAQNAGRVEGMRQAQALGVKDKKRWMAFLDNSTRDAHADLDGQVVNVNEPFDSILGPIMYPGDPDAAPGNVYNCRCTLTYEYPEFPCAMDRMDESGENVGDMTYRQWKAAKG
jgi:SPP1 gp7 family putative phage head morphogenesis protein